MIHFGIVIDAPRIGAVSVGLLRGGAMGLRNILLFLGLALSAAPLFAQEQLWENEASFFDGGDELDPSETEEFRGDMRELLNLCRATPPRVEEVRYTAQLVNGALPPGGGLSPGHIALTFDDGPSPVVSGTIRRTLEACGIRAGFFYVGTRVRWMETHRPEDAVVRATLAAGHSVGSHSMNHARGLSIGRLASQDTAASRAELDFQVRQGHEVVTNAAGVWTSFMRFPYGAGWNTPEALAYVATLGITNFHWNMDTGDADPEHRRGGPAVLAFSQESMMRGGDFIRANGRHCSNHAAPGCYNRGGILRGGIVLAHEKTSTASALPRLLRWMIEEGATFVVFTD